MGKPEIASLRAELNKAKGMREKTLLTVYFRLNIF